MKVQGLNYPPDGAGIYKQPTFGILKSHKKKPYGYYMVGEYKGKKIEVFNAYKNNQLLIYVSEKMNFVKSKLIYFQDGIKKVMRAGK